MVECWVCVIFFAWRLTSLQIFGVIFDDFQPMVWVFGPWFSNSIFGIEVSEVSKDLILYVNILCNAMKETKRAVKL